VPLQLGREREELLRAEVDDAVEESLGRDDARDDGGTGGAETPTVRDGATSCRPGSGTPTAANAWAMERTTRFVSSVGTSPSPTPCTSTVAPGLCRTVTVSSS
jgi:hypothetical protein